MAKKLIKDYRFVPGVIPPATNQYPNAVALIEANKTYVVKEIMGYLESATGTPEYKPSAANAVPRTITLLTDNKEFIKEEASAWIEDQIASATAPFVGYVYDATKKTKCKRDIGYLIDAFILDLTGGGNAETIRIARMFYLNGEAQLLNPIQEAATHEFVKELMNTYVLTNTVYTSSQIIETQVTNAFTTELEGIAKVDTLNDIVIDLITNGLTSLPAISYNFNQTFANYVYGATKCRRDIGYILDGVAFDVALTTNYNAVFLGIAESNSLDFDQTVIDVINASKAQVLALSAVSSSATAVSRVNSDYAEILTIAPTGYTAASALTFTNPTSATTSQIAAKDKLVANRAFIIAEINAWVDVNYPAHDHSVSKCGRDVGFAVDALCYDILYGGNSAIYDSAKFFNYAFGGITDDHLIQTVAAYGRLKAIVGPIVQGTAITKSPGNALGQTLSGNNAGGSDATQLQSWIQIISDVVETGNTALPGTRTTPSVGWATSALQSAKTAINNAKTTIIDAVVTYEDYTYDAAKCERDTTYILDAYLHDMKYGGNALSSYVAERYYINGVVQVNRPTVEVLSQTVARDIINDYILQNKYHPSYQWTEYQVVDSQYVSEGAADNQITTLSDIIIGTITNGLSGIPKVIPPNGLAGDLFPNAVALLEANKKFIIEETIAYIQYNVDNNISPYVFFTYNSPKCKRDISYIIEGYITDFKHGGNRQTVFNASKYWENGIAQVDGDRLPEVYAHTFIRDLLDNYIFKNIVATPKQTEVTQATLAEDAESFAPTKLKELSNTVLEVIQYGLTYLPDTVSNRGYIKIQGFYKLKDFLLITNTTRNKIIYNFADPSAAAEVTYSEFADSDFPAFLNTADKITTITFDADTSTHMVTDNIQIFVEGKYQEVRLNPIGTDAMERMKVGLPQSMLDADFEYGLQPTKWQAIAMMRNYPSIYEIPGTDTAVLTVTTDASVGTANIGASLITVTTSGPHGFTIGTPFTIKALANTILGFSRAEGSFLVNTVVSSTVFTYYAKAKVGSADGQVLASTYTQLRKGNFYTGAAVGTPTFSVASNGASGTLTTVLATPAGSDTFGFSGTAPTIGAPFTTTGTGVTVGTQVTGVTGTGGTAASTTLVTRAEIADTSIIVTDTTGIVTGLVFDRGDGRAVQVTDVTGSTVSLSGQLTSAILGTNATYTNQTQSATTGDGLGAVFSVSRADTAYLATPTTAGTGYRVSDTVTILGGTLDGTDTTNDATLTIATATPMTPVTGLLTASLVGGTGYTTTNEVATTSNSVAGTGLTVDIVANPFGAITASTLSAPGTGYIDTTGNGTSGGNGNSFVIDIVTSAGAVTGYTVVTPGTGYLAGDVLTILGGNADATINVASVTNGEVTSVTINNGGSEYQANDIITITTGNADAQISVQTVGADGGAILSVTADGTPITAPTKNFTSSVTIGAVTTADINSGVSLAYSAIATIQVDFPAAHGFIPGNSITIDISSTGSNHNLAAGPYYVESVPLATRLRYTARSAGTVDTATPLLGTIYARPDSYFVHRPFDGGVQLGTGGPAHGATAIRMSKKYIRYQSGKGIMYNTGALFAPSYDIRSMTATGTTVGSYITVATDDTDHGCQVNAEVTITGSLTSGYNGVFKVVDVIDERTFRVQANQVLGATSAILDSPCQMAVRTWHGATVRAGTFDDQNGMFWQYDGQRLAVGRRSSTFQVAGTISINANSNLVTGTSTRFTQQLAAGDRVVIRGMSHVVTQIASDTSMTVSPDFRGAINVTNVKICKTVDIIIPQEYWDNDACNGSGPSGFNIDITKMQMIGMQWTWYGAGFIDFMLRGADGNYVFAHRFRTSNVNTEAYMRTGNMPVRYEVINEGAKGVLTSAMTNNQTTIPMSSDDCYWFPNSGTVIVDNEMISFTGNSGTALTGCTRGAQLTQFVSGSTRSFTGGAAAIHAIRAGVILISNTVTPIISHWGSAFMLDGRFDEDRGYIFNYAATNVAVSTTKATAFLIRLAPSVSNAITGDLGERELINRAQLLLKGIAITSDTGTGGIVIEGVLNPQNYPVNPADITWTGLQNSAQGGQPSFAQIAAGGSVNWNGGASSTTATATTQANMTGTVTLRPVLNSAGNPSQTGAINSLFNGRSYFYVLDTDYLNYQTAGANGGWAVGDTISGTGIQAGTTITNIALTATLIGSTNYYRIDMSLPASQTISGATTRTITRAMRTSSTSTLFFDNTTFIASNAKAGTEVSDALFPANTFISTAVSTQFFGTTYWRVTTTQTSTSTTITPGTTQITFKFGQPAYAQPGETVFSFIANPGGSAELDLSELKELTNTTLGGRGTYPNGPDVLAINVYKASGATVSANLVIRWGEAQA